MSNGLPLLATGLGVSSSLPGSRADAWPGRENETEWVAAAIRTIFTEPGTAAVHAQVDIVAGGLEHSLRDVGRLLREARADLTVFAGFLVAHWRESWSTIPLERHNSEVKRRTDVVGIFPADNDVLRLVSCVCMAANVEWQVSDRRYVSEDSIIELVTRNPGDKPTKEICGQPPHPRSTIQSNA